MWVFPGGRVDAGRLPGRRLRRRRDREPQRRGARGRRGVRASSSTATSLVPFAHWTPPPEAPKRFSTQFFVAPAPEGAVTIDDGEIRDHMWVSPAEAMRRRDALEIELAPPTWVTLHTLRAARHRRRRDRRRAGAEPEHFTTKAAITDEGVVVMWHGDAGYEDGDAAARRRPPPALDGRHRLALRAHRPTQARGYVMRWLDRWSAA